MAMTERQTRAGVGARLVTALRWWLLGVRLLPAAAHPQVQAELDTRARAFTARAALLAPATGGLLRQAAHPHRTPLLGGGDTAITEVCRR